MQQLLALIGLFVVVVYVLPRVGGSTAQMIRQMGTAGFALWVVGLLWFFGGFFLLMRFHPAWMGGLSMGLAWGAVLLLLARLQERFDKSGSDVAAAQTRRARKDP